MIVWILAALASATTHEVELTGGAGALVRGDRMVSPIPHRGLAPTAGIGWSPRGERDVNAIRLGFSPVTLRSGPDWEFSWDGEAKSTGPDAISLAEIQYAYGRRIDGKGWTLNVGGTLHNRIEDVATHYGTLGVKTYLGVFGLGPWMDLRVPTGERHRLEFEGWAPVASWIARNPYGVHDDEYIENTRDLNTVKIIGRFIADGDPRTLNQYQAVHLRAGWTFDVSDRFTLVTRARLDGIHLTISHPMVEWQTGLDLGIRGRF